MANRIEEEPREFADPNDIKTQITEYVRLKASIDALDSRAKELRDHIFSEIDINGYEDDKGNYQLDLDTPIDGVLRLEKQRRTTRKLDELKAEAILTELGLKDELYVMVPKLDEDALMAAHWDGKVSEEQLDEMFPVTVTWALRTLKK